MNDRKIYSTDVFDVDVYDFDRTIFPVDSGSLFISYCLLHYPQTWIYIPYGLDGLTKYALREISLRDMKNYVFRFVSVIPKEKAAEKFWDKYEKFIYPWGRKESRRRFSVLCSASPDFLINEIGSRLEFDVIISTIHDEKGRVIGQNCHDNEKVRRIREVLPNVNVINVYSDSLDHDRPIFSLGQHCFHAVNGARIPFVLK